MEKEVFKLIESEKLEKVSGGYVFHASPGNAGVRTKCWEVAYDGSGEVVGRCKTHNEALKLEMAKAKGQSSREIYWYGEDGLWRLRKPHND